MSGINIADNRVGTRSWQAGFVGSANLVPFPARLVEGLFNDDLATKVILGAEIVAGTNEVQTISISATSGNWSVTLTGTDETTGAIAYNISTSALQTALNGLLGPGNVKVTGTAGSSYVLTFIGDYAATNVSATLLTVTNVSLAGGSSTVSIATTTGGVAGSTSLTCTALEDPIPSGAFLVFGNGQTVITSAAAAKGATSISILSSAVLVPTGDTAYYSPVRRKFIRSGRLVGRTLAEAAAKTGFGPADVDVDEEIFLTAFDVEDAYSNPEVEFLRKGEPIYIDLLPGYSTLSAEVLAWIRANYICLTSV
jgi:hypothetical protein